MKHDTVWLVGKREEGKPWEVMGIFSDEQQAVAACTERNYFVGPIPMNTLMPDAAVPWPGCRYPLGEEEEMPEAVTAPIVFNGTMNCTAQRLLNAHGAHIRNCIVSSKDTDGLLLEAEANDA